MVIAIQCGMWVEGLSFEELFDSDSALISSAAAEFNAMYGDEPGDWYWDGDPIIHLKEERKKMRRRLEDRIRKDEHAFKRAWYAVTQY
jgi:hypothetical protein